MKLCAISAIISMGFNPAMEFHQDCALSTTSSSPDIPRTTFHK
ncbi:MAG: hypothetical protein PHO37_06610 [Kiritimatiellae bacterium]|nr:hypothetical protein [Kiritimatiellia bacterium]